MATKAIHEDIMIHLLRDGNEQGLRLLYRNYKDAIFGIISNIVRSEPHAEEVLNDVFLKFFENIQSYDASKSRLFTWMARIARNAAIDKIRTADFKAYAQSIRTDDPNTTISSPADHTVEYQGIQTILQALSPDQRRMIHMVYLLGYTHQECADELQVPLGTVKTNVRRGILQLRDYFAKDIQAYTGMIFLIILYIILFHH
jgi:RNA polymerase sigma-70 factor, ECF subfamily